MLGRGYWNNLKTQTSCILNFQFQMKTPLTKKEMPKNYRVKLLEHCNLSATSAGRNAPQSQGRSHAQSTCVSWFLRNRITYDVPMKIGNFTTLDLEYEYVHNFCARLPSRTDWRRQGTHSVLCNLHHDMYIIENRQTLKKTVHSTCCVRNRYTYLKIK